MTPQAFSEKWKTINREQLRAIVRVSKSTVDHWFTDRACPETVQAHLDTIDAVLESIQQLHQKHPHLFEIYVRGQDLDI